jgi:hypothetical protein
MKTVSGVFIRPTTVPRADRYPNYGRHTNGTTDARTPLPFSRRPSPLTANLQTQQLTGDPIEQAEQKAANGTANNNREHGPSSGVL